MYETVSCLSFKAIVKDISFKMLFKSTHYPKRDQYLSTNAFAQTLGKGRPGGQQRATTKTLSIPAESA